MVSYLVCPYFLFPDDVRSSSKNIDYRNQEDEQVASRGSISMKTAVLRSPTGGEKVRFEVHSSKSRTPTPTSAVTLGGGSFSDSEPPRSYATPTAVLGSYASVDEEQ
jgi:hypothetical protein